MTTLIYYSISVIRQRLQIGKVANYRDDTHTLKSAVYYYDA
jgi:hypothetical protein